MISRVYIRDVKGIEDLELRPGALTVVQGQNGCGKSSVLDALRAVFEGGHDPDLIRHGATKALIEIELEDGTKITRKITARQSDLTVLDPAGRHVKAPAAFVKQIAEGFGFDPIAFVTAPAKKRAEYLASVMPIHFTRSELARFSDELEGDKETFSLDDVAAMRLRVYERRTSHNTIARDAEGTRADLSKALPEDDGQDCAADLASVEESERTIRAALSEEVNVASAELSHEIERINAEAEECREAARAAHRAKIAWLDKQSTPRLTELAERKALLKARVQERARLTTLRAQIEAARAKVRENTTAADKLTRTLERLDALMADKLSSIPIAGLEARAGEVFYEGLPFDHLNTAKQYLLAFEIVCRFGPGKILIADKAEHLDPDTYRQFTAAAQEVGIQIFTARVTGDPQLKVETFAHLAST